MESSHPNLNKVRIGGGARARRMCTAGRKQYQVLPWLSRIVTIPSQPIPPPHSGTFFLVSSPLARQ